MGEGRLLLRMKMSKLSKKELDENSKKSLKNIAIYCRSPPDKAHHHVIILKLKLIIYDFSVFLFEIVNLHLKDLGEKIDFPLRKFSVKKYFSLL